MDSLVDAVGGQYDMNSKQTVAGRRIQTIYFPRIAAYRFDDDARRSVLSPSQLLHKWNTSLNPVKQWTLLTNITRDSMTQRQRKNAVGSLKLVAQIYTSACHDWRSTEDLLKLASARPKTLNRRTQMQVSTEIYTFTWLWRTFNEFKQSQYPSKVIWSTLYRQAGMTR